MKSSRAIKFCSTKLIQRRGLASVGGIRGEPPPQSTNSTKQHTVSTFATATQTKPDESVNNDFPYLCQVPLSETPKDFPKPIYATLPKFDSMRTELSSLDSGLRIASEAKFGEFCTIGVMIDVGSRYEAAFPSGVSHFLEKLAFNSTKSFTSREEIANLLEKYGGMVDCQATKDTIVYAASCHKSGVEPVLKLIADAVLRPLFSDEELSIARNIVASDVETVNMKPEPDEILQDWIHAAAYRDNTLGLPKICPLENIDKINRDALLKFMKTYFIPKRMVVSGVGVSHEEFVDLSKKYFDAMPPVWSDQLKADERNLLDDSIAQYTGGIIKKEKDLSNISLAINPFPNLAHFVLGFESSSYNDPDFVPFCVLNSLLGGGGSFSAGGPGKGMYTRLYLNVLNRCYWMYNATSFNLAYADTGLFYIHASADPEKLSDVSSVIINEYLRTTGELEKTEFERAKTQLQSMLMMNLEQRPVIFEDICRQVLGHGHRKPAVEILEEIKRVTVNDMHRIADRMLSTKPSVVGYGTLKELPDYEKIDQSISKRDVRFLKSSKYFSWR